MVQTCMALDAGVVNQRPNLSRCSGRYRLFLALFEAEGIVAGFWDIAVVGDTVEHCIDHPCRGEDLSMIRNGLF